MPTDRAQEQPRNITHCGNCDRPFPCGVEGTVPAQWYLDLKRENQRLRAAADEPGETPCG